MKLTAKVTYIAKPIEIIKKDGEKMKKQLLCIEEVNTEKEHLDRLALDLVDDKIGLLNGINEGDVIEVFFNCVYNKREDNSGEEKIFNSLRAWKINMKQKGTGKVEDSSDDGNLPF